jgi:uncharacterized protein YllA (UPF0747 family)
MFTIKVVEDDGNEFVKSEVRTVEYNPPVLETGKEANLYAWYKDERPETFFSGKIYVMNENGKTVANYDLRDHFPKITKK